MRMYLSVFFVAACLAGRFAQAKNRAQEPIKMTSGYASVNGLKMYYEIHGSGAGVPLLLLHGGGSTIDSNYGRLIPLLSPARKIIAVEEQAHGRTNDRNRPVRFESSADDVAALMNELKVAKADVMGFSNGASVALQVAIRHPNLVHKLIFASSMTKKSGTRPEFWEGMKGATFENMPQPLKDAFLKVNPDPKKLRLMAERDIERMTHFTDVPDKDLRGLQIPTLIMQGDRDVPTPEHAAELSHLIPNSRLLIVPGQHGDYFGDILFSLPKDDPRPRLTAGWIEEFLNSP